MEPVSSPDPFADPAPRQGATQALAAVVRVAALLLPVLALLQILRGDSVAAIAPVALLALAMPGLLLLLRRGQLAGASRLLVILLILASVATLAGQGSIRGTGIVGCIGAVAIAGLFFGSRGLVVTIVLASGLVGLLAAVEAGSAADRGAVQRTLSHWLVISLELVAFGVGMRFARKMIVATTSSLHSEFAQRRVAEAELQAKDDLFESALRSSATAFIVSDLEDGRIRAVNPAYEKLFSRKREELIGFTHRELGIWADYADRKRYIDALREHGRVSDYPCRFVRADGEFDTLVSGEIVTIAGRQHAVTSFMDQSDLVETRRRLKRSDERFSKVFHTSPIAMSITRAADGLILENNAAMERLLGYRIREIGRATTAQVGSWVDPADRDRLIEMVRREGAVAAFEARMRTRGGEVFDANVWATIIDLDGEPCVLGALVNVTQQKREEALILSIARGVSTGIGQDLFRDLVTNLREAIGGDLVVIGEIDGTQVRALEALRDGEHVAGLSYPLAGTPCAAAIEGSTPFVVADGLAQRFPVEGSAPGLLDGMRSYIGACLRDANGQPMGMLSVLRREPWMASPKREALFQIFAARARSELLHLRDQRRILELNESLEQRVRTRTAQLEDAVRELESFSYSVSHDLRSPLRAISGYASLVLEEAGERLDEEQRRYLRRCVDASGRMGALVDDLISLARVGRRELEHRPVDLSAMFQDLAEEVIALDKERGVVLRVEPGVQATCDHGLMKVVLENLLRNALKFTSRVATRHIEFGVEPGPVYFVKDNGVGFEPTHAGTLFKPFHRLHTDAEYGGTGIGLATVARVVERHGGRAWADARPNEGAVIRFTLGERAPSAR